MDHHLAEAGRRRRWICAVCVTCLFGLIAAGGQAWRDWRYERRGVEPASEADTGRRSGINVELAQYGPHELDLALSDVADLGFYWLRQRFPWQVIEPQPGVYEWARWDGLVEAVQRHGLGLIAVLDTPPSWALRQSAVPLPCVPPWDEEAYARFAAAFARRYSQAIDYYQVWDEPNLSHAWNGGHVAPCAYVALLKAAYPALHAADPTVHVLAGGLAPTQAPGPDNLNDLTFLRQMYAAGGGPYFDLLAAKPYGFWSGPEDRRVAADVLNFPRVIGLREQMVDRGDADKRVWAVEWGWHVHPAPGDGEPPLWATEAPPWGTDVLAMQRPRILGAAARAAAEWPWMEVMCWAEYQPQAGAADPRWGFALRSEDGSPAALYDVLRSASTGWPGAVKAESRTAVRWWLSAALPLAGGAALALAWRRCACGLLARQAWQRWVALPARYHLGALTVVAVLYALTPWPEWVAVELALAAMCLYAHPGWALWGAVFATPFFYLAKPVGTLQISPAENLLLLAVVLNALSYLQARCWPSLPGGLRRLDLVWLLWLTLGVFSPSTAPDPALAWREWRLCMLDPALLYLLLRLGDGQVAARAGQPGHKGNARLSLHKAGSAAPGWATERSSQIAPAQGPLLAWALSGTVVALVGIGQRLSGALVPAGSVGRVSGVFYSPNHLALYLERIWPLALALGYCGGLSRRWRAAARWGAVAMGVALYLTYSRGAWLLAIPAALFTIGWCCRRHLRWTTLAGGSTVLLLAMGSVLWGRVAASAELSSEVRVPVWQSTVQMIADHPWRGVGLDGFRFVYPAYMRPEAWTEPVLYHPHNAWLDAAVRLGLPGLVAFLALVVYSLRWLLAPLNKKGKSDGLSLPAAIAVGCLAGLLAGLAHGLVDSGYFLADLAWSLALATGLVRSHEQRL